MFFAVKLGVEYGVRVEILFKTASAIMSPSLQTVIRNAGIVGDVKPACKQIGWARHFAIRNFPDRPRRRPFERVNHTKAPRRLLPGDLKPSFQRMGIQKNEKLGDIEMLTDSIWQTH